MPFVQRVVSPTYLSRSRPRACHAGQGPKAGASIGRQQPLPKVIAGPSVVNGDRIPGESVTFDVTDSYVSAHNHQNCDPQTSSSAIAHEIIANGTFNGNGLVGGSGPHLLAAPTVALSSGSRSSSPSTGRSGSGAGSVALVPLSLSRPNSPAPVVTGHEFESVTNITLSNALRQLASLVLIANDIFTELNEELQAIGDRSRGIQQRIVVLEEKVQRYDPKLVPVPESDLEAFVHIKNHFKSIRPVDKELFTPATRSSNLRQLYEAAAKTPISSIRESGETNGEQDTELICTPVLGQKYRKMRSRIDVEIETRLPAAVEELRKWTSTEALGDITVTPDCISRVGHSTSIMNNTTTTSTFNSSTITRHGNVSSVSPSRIVQQHHQQQQQQQQLHQQFSQSSASTGIHSIDVTDDNSTVIGAAQLSSSSTTSNNNNRTANEDDDLPLDHRLPSPEEQCQIIAMKFPAEVVTVDVTGRRFQRMCNARKSMTNYMAIGDHNNLDDDVQTVRRRSRSRKPRGKRRNTIAGTDQREIEEAANGLCCQRFRCFSG